MPDKLKHRGQSVLIVEDDAVSRCALVHLLKQLGYDSVPVGSVAEGVERLNGQHRAILDLNLPDGLGTHVLERIRDENRPIRVAVTTGADDRTLLGDLRRLRVELILHKPIDLLALVEWLDDDDDAGKPAPAAAERG